jgi:hypothetical protein
MAITQQQHLGNAHSYCPKGAKTAKKAYKEGYRRKGKVPKRFSLFYTLKAVKIRKGTGRV